MWINEVCARTGLTKKAVAYYEAQGLLCPEALENGYRVYTDEAADALREIALLRQMGVGVAEIKTILTSEEKLAALSAVKAQMTRQANLLAARRACVDRLLANGYDVEDAARYAACRLDENRAIKERLAEAFPGSYGLFLSFHFGRFLTETIDSPAKEAAYGKILAFLDGLADLPFPKEAEDFLTEADAARSEEVMRAVESGVNAALDDTEGFLTTQKEFLEKYLAYCQTDEYKASPGYKIKQQMLAFQSASGYYDVFVENMKILSGAYATYHEKLRAANDRFVKAYPDAADRLGYS